MQQDKFPVTRTDVMHLHYLFPFMSGDALSPKAESTSSVVIRLWGLPRDSSSLLPDVRTKLGGGRVDCCFPTLGATNCSCCCGSYKLGAIIVSLRTANIYIIYLFIYLFMYLFIYCSNESGKYFHTCLSYSFKHKGLYNINCFLAMICYR